MPHSIVFLRCYYLQSGYVCYKMFHIHIIGGKPMICPNCGSQTNGTVCTVCGATIKPKKPTGLIVLCIILAVIVVACAVLLFILPSASDDVGTVAKNYVTAAYYTDKVVNNAQSYSTYNDFKKDINIAIDACSAINGGAIVFLVSTDYNLPFGRVAYAVEALDGLDTDAGSGYSGGYTEDAKENIDDFISDMGKDAAIAKDVLQALDNAIDKNTSDTDKKEALSDAKDALSEADNTTVVVGDKDVSFSGINVLDGINTALIGADIMIDKDTLYLGADDSVIFHCENLGTDITVIDSANQDGVVMDIGDIIEQQVNGALMTITFSALDATPEALLFIDAEKQQFIDVISEEIGGFAEIMGDTAANVMNIADNTVNSESGVFIDDPSIVGTWIYSTAVVNPWATLNGNEMGAAESLADMYKTPSKIMLYPDKEVEQYMIFRNDGTGISYYNVDDVGIYMPYGFWWRKDASGAIVAASGVSAGYEFEWTDQLRQVMQNFQNGDYSDFVDTNSICRLRTYDGYIYELKSSDYTSDEDADICIVYERTTSSTDFEYDN